MAGFSSPAVITVLAMFILSAGLSRTGVAYRIGQPLQLFARKGEAALIVVLMAAAGILSALINTITVAVILLPATMDLARRSGLPPARLLMPMALGCLLGGPFTGISTPPNILATDALRSAGLTPFAIFDFTPSPGPWSWPASLSWSWWANVCCPRAAHPEPIKTASNPPTRSGRTSSPSNSRQRRPWLGAAWVKAAWARPCI